MYYRLEVSATWDDGGELCDKGPSINDHLMVELGYTGALT
jgi:hypothetical protein